MFQLTRREALISASLASAFGLSGRVVLDIPQASAETALEPTVGFKTYKVGDVEVTAIYDGLWKKPHDPAFIKNASQDDVKAALAKAGQTTDFMPIPLTVVLLNIGGKLVMINSGSGVGQWQPNATNLPANMEKAGIDPKKISTILISHFHPDHIFGLMEKGTNAATFAHAELVVQDTEYAWWTEAGRVEKLPEARKVLGTRIQATFPSWKNVRLAKDGAEVVPGVRLVNAPGHTPGHAAYHLSSGAQQLMISNDVMYVPALLAPNPDWQGAYDQDGPLAVETRKRLVDRVIADKMMICGAHFPFPGLGTFVKDGNAYGFTPVGA